MEDCPRAGVDGLEATSEVRAGVPTSSSSSSRTSSSSSSSRSSPTCGVDGPEPGASAMSSSDASGNCGAGVPILSY